MSHLPRHRLHHTPQVFPQEIMHTRCRHPGMDREPRIPKLSFIAQPNRTTARGEWRHAGGRNTCVRTQGCPIQYFRTDFLSCRHAAARRRARQRGAGSRGAPRSQHAAALQVRRAHSFAHVLLQLGLHLAPLDRLGRGRARALFERLRGRRRGRQGSGPRRLLKEQPRAGLSARLPARGPAPGERV